MGNTLKGMPLKLPLVDAPHPLAYTACVSHPGAAPVSPSDTSWYHVVSRCVRRVGGASSTELRF